MRKIPRLSIALGLFFIGIALSLPIQIAMLFDHSWSEISAIFHKLTSLNVAVMLLAAWNAVLLFRLSPLLKVFLPLFLITVAWNNYIVGASGLNYSMEQSQLGTLLIASFCSVLALEPYRKIIKEPGKRWWLVPPRKMLRVPVHAHHQLGISFFSNTFDLSSGGAFITLSPNLSQNQKSYERIEPGMIFDLKIKVNYFQKVQVKAEVVRKAEAKGHYPKGIGVRFTDLNRKDRHALQKIMEQSSL